MNIKKIVDKGYFKLIKISRKIRVAKNNNYQFSMLKKYNIPIKKLNKAQRRKVDDIYKKYGCNYNYKTHELCYSVTGVFDPYIMPEDLFRIDIELRLDDLYYRDVLADKNYLELYMPDVIFPKSIIRNIRGIYYDNHYNILSNELEVANILKKYDYVVLKPSKDTGDGNGVQLIKSTECLSYINKSNYRDFVIQEKIQQHETFSKLNESSVNIVRIISVFIDGKVYCVSSSLRVGEKGHFTDNTRTSDGKGLIIVGIDEKGKLKETGYYPCGLTTKTAPSGVILKGITIPKYKEMIKLVTEKHKLFPYIGFLGWDITVDKNENIIVVEYNAKSPGVRYYQFCNGALLGDKTEEILDKVYKNK